jgi:hypothetical protein
MTLTIQDLRHLTRTRKQLVREMARHTQRRQKPLEDANVKLTEVISDILGTSGRKILKALVAGETDPERLADLRSGRLKATRAEPTRRLGVRRLSRVAAGVGLHRRWVPAEIQPRVFRSIPGIGTPNVLESSDRLGGRHAGCG